MGHPKFTPKSAPSLRRLPHPSNTPIPQPTPLTIPNGIRIQSAILPQYTFQTYRQTDQPTNWQIDRWINDRSTPLALMLTILIESNALIILNNFSWPEHTVNFDSIVTDSVFVHKLKLHQMYDICTEVRKKDYQNYSVLWCVHIHNMHTHVSSSHRQIYSFGFLFLCF